jgi:hypothetical protein
VRSTSADTPLPTPTSRTCSNGGSQLEALRRARVEQIEAVVACGIAWSDERHVLAGDI